MMSLSAIKQSEIIKAYNSTSRYLDDLLNIDNPYFEGMVNRIYKPELQLNKANTSDTEAPFLDLHLFQTNLFHLKFMISVMTDFDIVKCPFFDWLCSPFYLLRRLHFSTNFLQQGHRYHKLRKTFSKFYRRHYELVSKFNVGLKHFCTKAYRNRNFMVT